MSIEAAALNMQNSFIANKHGDGGFNKTSAIIFRIDMTA